MDRNSATLRRSALVGSTLLVVALLLWFRNGSSGATWSQRKTDRDDARQFTVSGTSHASHSLGPAAPKGAIVNARAQGEDAELSGLVLTLEEAPVTGARVTLSGRGATAQSNEHGEFQLRGLAHGRYVVTAELNGSRSLPIVLDTDMAVGENVLYLRKVSAVDVEVTAAELNEPLGGAEIAAYDDLGHMVGRAVTSQGTAVTRVEIATGVNQVVATASGRIGESAYVQSLPLEPVPQRLKMRLAKGSLLHGRVVTMTHEGIAGARVTAYEAGAAEGRPAAEVETDLRGRFELTTLAPKTYRIEAAKHSMGATARTLDVRTVSASADIELVLDSSGIVRGRVVNSANAPVAAARVSTLRSRYAETSIDTVVADTNGAFELVESAAVGKWIRAASGTEESAPTYVNARRSNTDTLELRLVTPAEIEGHVVSADGAAAPGAIVQATCLSRQCRPQRAVAAADEHGKFTILRVSRNPYALHAFVAGIPTDNNLGERRGGVRVVPPAEDVELTLQENASLQGRVVLPGGSAPGRFNVHVDGGQPIPFSDTGGDFRLPQVSPGSHTLIISGDEFSPTTVGPIAVSPGSHSDLGEILLRTGHSVTGVVVDMKRVPVPYASVSVATSFSGLTNEKVGLETRESPGFQTTVADGQGRFEFSHVEDGPLSFLARDSRERNSGAVVRTVPTPPIELVIASGTRISGLARRAGQGVPEVNVALLSEHQAGRGDDEAPSLMLATTTDETGAFVFDGIQRGRYALTAVDYGAARVSVLASTIVSVEGQPELIRNLELAATGVSVRLKPAPQNQGAITDVTLVGAAAYQALLSTEPVVLENVATGAYKLCSTLKSSGATACADVTINQSTGIADYSVPTVPVRATSVD